MKPRIHVLHENNDWTLPLERRLAELNVPYELWHLGTGQFDLSAEPPPGLFYSRMSASSHTRDHRYAPELTEAVMAWLERHGRRVVNGSRALRLEVSKVKQYLALDQAGIVTPKTIVASGKPELVEAARKLGMLPFITKHNRAGKGQGVQLFNSIEALEAYLNGPDFDQPVDGITLVQQYIEAPVPSIVRHEFIGGRFFYAVRVDTSGGFELCPADSCSVDGKLYPGDDARQVSPPKFEILTEYRPELISRYEKFLRENAVEVAGIEAIEDQSGKVYTYDVNTNTNYNADAEAVAKRFAMLALAEYLKAEFEAVQAQS